MKIMVVGSGTMGLGICEVLMSSGHEVILNDIKEEFIEKGVISIGKSIEKNVAKGKITEEEKIEIINKLSASTNLKDAVECDIIIEAIYEDIEVKKKIFKELDYICQKKTILASNTSSLSITEISMSTKRPDRVIGMHFFNPAQVMKLIEVIDGIFTSKETHNVIVNLSNSLNKTPVKVEESPGFIANRILIPMINEAIGIYADGVASIEDIDNAMKLGANHPIGPLALGDLIGLDVCLYIMEVLYKEYGDTKYRPHPYLRKMVRGNILGRKTDRGFYDYKIDK